MKMIVVLLCFGSICFQSLSQVIGYGSPCEGSVRIKSKFASEIGPVNYSTYLKYYVDSLYPGMSRYIEPDKSRLIQIEPFRCNDAEVVFIDTQNLGPRLICELRRISKVYTFEDTSLCIMIPVITRLADVIGKELFGRIEGKPQFKYDLLGDFRLTFDSTSVEVEERYLEHLINPNLCYTESFIKPIGLFYSSSKDVYYLYIYGSVDYNADHYERFSDSYVSKVIFNRSGIIGNITVPGEILNLFMWYECPDFFPF